MKLTALTINENMIIYDRRKTAVALPADFSANIV
jgi:hypothetical protein